MGVAIEHFLDDVFGGDEILFCSCIEPFDRSLDRLSMLPRRLGHEVGSKPAPNRARDKVLVGQGHPHEMSIESLSNCQCVITGPVTFRADRKVDNKILDHGRSPAAGS